MQRMPPAAGIRSCRLWRCRNALTAITGGSNGEMWSAGKRLGVAALSLLAAALVGACAGNGDQDDLADKPQPTPQTQAGEPRREPTEARREEPHRAAERGAQGQTRVDRPLFATVGSRDGRPDQAMMDGSTLLTVAMVVMMAVMMGGMVAGAAWVIVRRRRNRDD
jgi:hypothetical protein